MPCVLIGGPGLVAHDFEVASGHLYASTRKSTLRNLAKALQQELVTETRIGPTLEADDQVLLINSLSCRSLKQVDGMELHPSAEAQQLWQQLLLG